MDSSVLSPRISDEFGRFRRLLIDESYTVRVNALGYESHEQFITPSSTSITTLNISLVPIELSELSINVTDSGILSEGIDFQLTHSNGLVDTLTLQLGTQNIEYPIGDYSAVVYADGKLPQFLEIEHGFTESLLVIDLKFENAVYNNSLENLNDWTFENGNWVNEDWRIKSQEDLKYSSNSNQVMTLSSDLSFEVGTQYAVKLELQYELEWEVDSLIIQLKNDDGIFSTTEISDQSWDSHFMYIPIPNGISNLTDISFRLTSDGSVDYRGFILNNLSIMESSDDEDLSNELMNINSFNLDNNYPNPFNPFTIINFQLGRLANVSLNVYDINGYLMETIIDNKMRSAGSYNYNFNGSQLASGIYFYELEVDGSRINKKMLLIK
jgi:hypothetical protein